MFEKVKEKMDMIKQANQIKKELEAVTVEINEIRGIKVVINGAQTVKLIDIEPTLFNPENKKRLENDLARSVNVAIRKSQTVAHEKMKHIMPGFPGL